MSSRDFHTRRVPPVTLKDRVRALLACGTVLGLGAVGTLAAWTDQSTASTGTFSTGTIDLKLGSTPVDNNPAVFTTALALANMAPGESDTTTLVVNNTGTVPFTYNLSGTATNSGAGTNQLGSAMQVQIFAGGTCTGTALNTPARFTFTSITARPLAAGSNDTLCFLVTLPSNADTALQATSTVGTFTFTATSA